MPVFLILLAVPLAEIALFVQLGGVIGLWPTLASVVATAVLGSVLVRSQGRDVLRKMQSDMDRGAIPTAPLAHGALIVMAGILLMTPGFLTDGLGLALLIPPVRATLIGLIARRILARADRQRGQDEPWIDTSYTVVDENGPNQGPRNDPGAR